jgi:hypothetical protein
MLLRLLRLHRFDRGALLGSLFARIDCDTRSFAATTASLVVHKQTAANQDDDEKNSNNDAKSAGSTTISHENLRWCSAI